MRKFQFLLAPIAAAVLAACAVGPNYHAPETKVAEKFDHIETTYSTEQGAAAFWHTFADPELEKLVTDALASNHDLRIALTRVQEARALRRDAAFDLAPSINASGGYTKTRTSSQGTLPGVTRASELYDAGFDAFWELDFFGGVRRGLEASRAELGAEEAALQDVQVIVTGEVTRTYFELRGQQLQLDVARRNVANQQSTLELAQVRLDAGSGTEFDTARAQAQLSSTLGTIGPLEAAVARSIHRLSVLVGREPGALRAELTPTQNLPSLPGIVPVGDPASLLRRRPDIRVAERELAGATAQIGVAVADLFPRVTFTGSAGYVASSSSALGDRGTDAYVLAPGISWGIFDYGHVQARIGAAKWRKEGALLRYEKTVLQALEETEDSLVTHARARDRLVHDEAAVQASTTAAGLARVRYENGASDFLQVLDAERTLLQSEDQLARSRTEAATSLIAVYKALGGGWEGSAPSQLREGNQRLPRVKSMSMSINPIDLAAAAEGILNTQYLLQRERLLSASAQASRLLLEAPDAMKAMPEVLQLLGEAAQVDRTALAFAEIGPNGEKWLKIQAEWVTESLSDTCGMGECDGTDPWNEPRSDQFCTMLQSGKSVVFCPDAARAIEGVSITSDKARTSAIVPILVDGEYVGVIGFDDWQRVREFDSSIVSALEIAAGLVGAALHRQRLVDTMRRERELAAEERLSSATRANALLRANLTKLARDADPQDFIGNILIDATRQLDAVAAYTIGFDKTANLWKAFIHVEGGKVVPPPYQATATPEETRLSEVLALFPEPSFYQVQPLDRIQWPGAADWHAREGHKSVYLLPVVVGEQTVGCIGLAFTQDEALSTERAELALAVAHQITLCIGLKKLGMAAKDAAVLAERNRIGQEIHDGLAQGFTGILMQLGAAEEAMHECARNSPLPSILTRIHDLARQGLADARRSVMALRPDQTKRVGLELALRQLAERATVEGRAVCSFEGAVIGEGLVPERQHELLRIATEAVSNALRHAHPSTVRIVLLEEIAQWTMSVIDDGRGMTLSPDLYAQQGYGLNNMRERAGAIGGEFLIESKPGEGTRIVINLPRPHAANVSKLKAQNERRG